MSENVKEEEGRTYTPEEIAAHKAKMQKFYEDNIPLLKTQLEYETLLTDIDEVRLRRVMVTQKTIELTMPSPGPETPPPSGEVKRPLRTE